MRRCHVTKPCDCDRGKRQKGNERSAEVHSKNKADFLAAMRAKKGLQAKECPY